jgi:hypothetical protein
MEGDHARRRKEVGLDKFSDRTRERVEGEDQLDSLDVEGNGEHVEVQNEVRVERNC